MSSFTDKFQFRNGLTLRNKVVMAPMTTWAGQDNGYLTDDEYVYYKARSSDVGLVITGTTYMQASGKGFSGQYYAGSKDFLPQLKKLAHTINSQGAKAILQIFHAGRNSNSSLTNGADVVSASAVAAERELAATPREMSSTEIEETVQSFADVTQMAIEAGFDGVEIHGANTYLIQQFFSPHSNRRNDQWGGSLKKRMRFPIEVTRAVIKIARTYASDSFVVGYRLSPEEYENPGISLDDSLVLSKSLVDEGIDYLHLSLKHYAMHPQRIKGDNRIIGEEFKKILANKIPLIGVGNIHTASDLENAFSLGYDLVSVGKALVYDPNWLSKIQQGREPITGLQENSMKLNAVPQKMYQALYELKEVMQVNFKRTM